MDMYMYIVDIVIFLIAFLFVFYYYGTKTYNHYKDTDVKYVKPVVPFMGNMTNLLFRVEDICAFVKRLYDSHKDERYIGLFEDRKPLIMIKDTEIIKQIGIKNFEEFHDHRNFMAGDPDDLFGNILFVMAGERWKEMRAALSPAFTSSKMRNMFAFIEETGRDMAKFFTNTKEVKEKGMIEIEVKDTLSRYTNDVIANAVFGLKVNSLEDRDNDIYRLGLLGNDFSGVQLLKFYGFAFFPSVMRFFKIPFTRSSVTKFFKSFVKEAIEQREKSGLIRHDMINLLMEAKKGTLSYETQTTESKDTGFATVEESDIGKQQIKKQWTDLELASQAFVFYIAGFETTSTLLTFLFYEMVRNPDIQKRLQEEIDEFIEKSQGKPVYADIQNMKYLDMTISETLRMWPPVPNVDRVCSKDFTLPPPNDYTKKTYTIKKNELVWIPIYGLMHDPKYFPNPTKFDPDRFSDENKSSIDPMSYLPFGVGPRNCIGSRFALLEIKILAFHILANFDIVRSEKTQIPLELDKSSFQLKVKGGLHVGLKPRKN